jgi:hypothetical protein
MGQRFVVISRCKSHNLARFCNGVAGGGLFQGSVLPFLGLPNVFTVRLNFVVICEQTSVCLYFKYNILQLCFVVFLHVHYLRTAFFSKL